jgi:predicted kinase
MEQAADRLAAFHRSIARLAPHRVYGSARLLQAQVDATVVALERAGVAIPSFIPLWCRAELGRLAEHLDQRQRQGFIRECHGDLHLDNLVQAGRNVYIFDCIAFSESLRWIDVMNDIAFLVMDLQVHGRTDFAACFLNRWLFQTGDFTGLRALRFYIVYRALVRTLVETVKARDDSATRTHCYLGRAIAAIRPTRPLLLLCHGFSGSGKSAASVPLSLLIGALRISSDTERKRGGLLQPGGDHKLPPTAYMRSSIDASYDKLHLLADATIRSGYSVIVDATFLKARHRRLFLELADASSIPVRILDFHAAAASLAVRI